MPAELQTEDLQGVEILSTGGPVHGKGSPPDGDFWKPEDLRAMAAAALELQGELSAPAKIGHGGDQPAVGWLHNVRTSDDGTKLLADVRKVPQSLARLLRAGAYRSRSVELSKLTSQKTGKKYDWVVTGLAWLGGKLPAVRTLDDVVKLYEGADAERRFLVEVENDRHDLGAVFETVLELASGTSRAAPDTRPTVPKLELTDEQHKQIADKLGVKPDELTAEKLLESVEPPDGDDGDGKGDGDGDGDGTTTTTTTTTTPEDAAKQRDLEAKVEASDKRTRDLEEKLRVKDRDHTIVTALREGRFDPGQRKYFEELYDDAPAKTVKLIESLAKDEDRGREYGSDDDGSGQTAEQKTEAEEKAYEADAVGRLGIPKEAIR